MSYDVARTVTVTIENDLVLTVAFLDWQRDEEVLPINGTTYSTGRWFGVFPAEHERALRRFFTQTALADAADPAPSSWSRLGLSQTQWEGHRWLRRP